MKNSFPINCPLCSNVSHEATNQHTHVSSLSGSSWCCVRWIWRCVLLCAWPSSSVWGAWMHEYIGIIFISSFIGNLQNAEVKTNGLADRGTNPLRYMLVLHQLVLFFLSESWIWARITHAFKQRIIAEELPWNHELQLGDGAVGEYSRETLGRMHLQDIKQ